MKDSSASVVYLVLIGAPGAGKGTQAASLSARSGLLHVASGDLFRDNVDRGTDLGKLAKSYMDAGELVPDGVTVKMVLDTLDNVDAQHGAILDGFPRTRSQAEALDAALAGLGREVGKAIYIEVNDEELLRRLAGRWICRSCQMPYHVVANPPKKEGVCDIDGGELYQRSDDSIDTARRRLSVYFEQTQPVLGYYRDRGLLETIEGGQSIHNVEAAMVRVLDDISVSI